MQGEHNARLDRAGISTAGRPMTWACSLALATSLALAMACLPASAEDLPENQRNKNDEDIAIRMHWQADSRSATFYAEGIDASQLSAINKAGLGDRQWEQLFAVYVLTDRETNPIPLFGTYRVSQDAVVFEPRFSLRPGLTYRAVFQTAQLPKAPRNTQPVQRTFHIPAEPTGPAATVKAIYPSRDILPENLLKFYIHFSAPMSRGEAYRRIHLVNQSGAEVEAPFLELGEELWDYSGTRFTLFFHPGRIKRGLRPREEMGPALEEGESYALVIDQRWLDANGQPLEKTFRKQFTITAPDYVQPEIKNWSFVAPQAGSKDPLIIEFGEPLDHAMLQRVLNIVDSNDRPIDGDVSVDRRERRWEFQPLLQWQSGDYELVVDSALEDLAGNSLGRPFEVDVFETVDQSIPVKTVRRSFTISAAAQNR